MGKVKKKFTPLQRYKVTIVVIKGLISQNPHLITFLTRNTAFKELSQAQPESLAWSEVRDIRGKQLAHRGRETERKDLVEMEIFLPG